MTTAPTCCGEMGCPSGDTNDKEADSSSSSEESSDEDSDENDSQSTDEYESKASEDSVQHSSDDNEEEEDSENDDSGEESDEENSQTDECESEASEESSDSDQKSSEDESSDETSEDSASDSGDPCKTVEVISRSFQNFSLDGVRSLTEVLSVLSKEKPDSMEKILRIVKKIKPGLSGMTKNFKQAHDEIEKETKVLQKLTEKWINDAEQMKIKKEKLEARIQQNEGELTANKENAKDLEKNISTLTKQIRCTFET